MIQLILAKELAYILPLFYMVYCIQRNANLKEKKIFVSCDVRFQEVELVSVH